MRLFAAYDVNTHLESMARRCPGARPIGAILLNGYRLTFRGLADLAKTPVWRAQCGLWEITEANELALDRFHGFPRLYVKETFVITIDGQERCGIFYVMRRQDVIAPPPARYESVLRAGYEDFGMSTLGIDFAIDAAKNRARTSSRGG